MSMVCLDDKELQERFCKILKATKQLAVKEFLEELAPKEQFPSMVASLSVIKVILDVEGICKCRVEKK